MHNAPAHAGDSAADTDWLAVSARNLAGSWLLPTEARGLPTLREPGVWAADPGSPHPLPNSATLVRPLTDEEAPALVARLRRFYGADSGRPWALWSAWPLPDLAPLGGVHLGHPPLMVRPPSPAPPAPADLAIREATDPAGLADFERVFVNGYPVPELQPHHPGAIFGNTLPGNGFRFWVGFAEGQPVTCAISYAADGIVGIYLVATLPEARGRGYGAAVTARAATAAPDLPAVLQASDLGRPVYARLGFGIVGRYTLWIFPPGMG